MDTYLGYLLLDDCSILLIAAKVDEVKYMKEDVSLLGLLHEDVGRIIGIHVGLLGKFTTADIVVQIAALSEHMHVVLEISDFDYQPVQILYKFITASFHEPQLEVTVPRKQVSRGRSATFEIGIPKEGELQRLLVEGGDWDVERAEFLAWLGTYKDNAMSCEICLYKRQSTVPFSSFLPRLSILTSNSISRL
jgi:hypothetical protein